MRFDARHLDADSLRYLRFIDAASGHGAPGVFHRHSTSPPADQGRWGWFLFLGTMGVLIAIALSRPQNLIDADLTVYSRTQAVVLGLGLALLTAAAFRAFRPNRPSGLGTFVYADALHSWVVRGDDVQAFPLTGLSQVEGEDVYEGLLYHHSVLWLYGDGARHKLTLFDQGDAAIFLRFFDVLLATRAAEAEAIDDPCALGVFARHVAWTQSGDGAPCPGSEPTPPVPRRTGSHPLVPVLTPWLVGLVAAITVGALLPGWNARWLDDYLFGLVPPAPSLSVKELEYYLEKRPHGAHAVEVEQMRDDRTFQAALRHLEAKGDRDGLVAYLADPRNTRHRREALHALRREGKD